MEQLRRLRELRKPEFYRRAVQVFCLAVPVFLCDQSTKEVALRVLDDRSLLYNGDYGFRLVFNKGAAFSTGAQTPQLFVVIATIASIGIIIGGAFVRTFKTRVACGIVLGGATGNLFDRVIRDHGGAVVDFIDLKYWAVFNIADSAIFLGCLWIAAMGMRNQNKEQFSNQPNESLVSSRDRQAID